MTTYNEATTDHGKKLIPEGSVVAALAHVLADRRIALDAARDAADEAEREYREVEAQLFDAMEAQNLTAIRTPRGLFRLNDLAWAKIIDGEAARAWAEANLPEVITLNLQRMAVVVRTALKAGQELPPGVDFTTSRKITWRRE
jgi:hypothetical protein